MTSYNYGPKLACIRRRKLRELGCEPALPNKDEQDRLQRLMTDMEQGGPDWAPYPDDGQWVDRTHQAYRSRPASPVDLENLLTKAGQEWVKYSLTPTNQRRLASILSTRGERLTREQINWIEMVVIAAEIKAEDDGEE